MIDPKQPPPGWLAIRAESQSMYADPETRCSHAGGEARVSQAHRIYAAESRPAVIDFAERITSWLESFHGPQADVIHEIAGIILAAARGERTLP